MAAIDFTTALARLLSDGRLRDAFAADGPAVLSQLNVQGPDCAALLALTAADLEFQARVLLRKRFEQARSWLPTACGRLGAEAWPRFAAYARGRAPCDARIEAAGFAECVGTFCSHSEMNRLRFAAGTRRLQIALVGELPVRGRTRRALQILMRHREGWREFAVYLGV